jgi:hypothetical protein
LCQDRLEPCSGSINSIDYTVNQRNSFRFRYIYNSLAAQDTNAQLSAFFQPTPQKNHFFSGSYFHTFSPNLANEFRVGFNRFSSITPSGNFSFPGLDSFPNLDFIETNVQIGPNPNAPQFNIQNLYQVTDNINYTHGKHTLVFGFDGRKYISPSSSPSALAATTNTTRSTFTCWINHLTVLVSAVPAISITTAIRLPSTVMPTTSTVSRQSSRSISAFAMSSPPPRLGSATSN